MHHFLSGLNRPVLFLKATHKKQVWIPQFSKKDGTIVGGHMAMVHVADDHDNAKVATGHGTHSQKKAHAALSSVPGFDVLPVEHQAAAVMYHATEIQDKASASAKESVAKKKAALLASNPEAIAPVVDPVVAADPGGPKEGATKPGENGNTLTLKDGHWTDLDSDEEKEKQVNQIVFGGSSWTLLSAHKDDPAVLGYTMEEVAQKWLEHNPTKAHELSSTLVDLGYLHIAKKMGIYVPPNAQGSVGAMLTAKIAEAAAKKAAGPSVEVQAVLEKITAAKLPESNTNHKPVNQKLDAIHAAVKAGDVKTILMHGYGSNTYAVKAAKLANEALAVLGSAHKVAPGQKMGTHAGLSGAAPVAVEKAALPQGPTTIPYLQGKFLKEKAEAGKVQDLKTLISAYLGNGANDAAAYANELLVAIGEAPYKPVLTAPLKVVAAKVAPTRPAKVTPTVSTLKTASQVAALSPGELPPVPAGAAATAVSAINAIAGLGNIDGLTAFHGNLPEYQKNTKAYAASVIKLMKEKQTKTPFTMDAPAVEPQPHHQPVPEKKGHSAHAVNFENTQPGHNKFWAMHLDGANLVTTYGKIGTNGKQSVKPFASQEAAGAAAQKLANAKLKSGYVKNGTIKVKQTPDQWVADVGAKDATTAAANSTVGLTPEEIQPSSWNKNTNYGKQAVLLAAAGDLDGLQKFADNLEKEGYKNNASYVMELHNQLFKKQGGGAATAAAMTDAEFAQIFSQFKNLDDKYTPVQKAKKLALSGDISGLHDLADTLQSGTPQTKQLVSNLIAALGGTSGVGPKEGDTKAGKGGTLVFHNGHWVLQDEADSDRWEFSASDMGLSGEASLTAHLGGGGDTVYVCHNGAGGFAVGHLDSNGADVKDEGNFFTLAEAVKHAESIGAPHFSTASLKKLDPSFQGQAPVKASKLVGAKVKVPEPTPTVITGAESIDGWKKTADKKGYNEGGFYTDPSGVEWYCKFPAGGEKVAKNELLASKLYALAGVENAEVKMIVHGGKVGLASKIVIGAKEDKAALLAGTAKGLMSGFAVDAWLANWDTVGNNPSKGFDNILIKPDGSAVRIDAGGALMYGGAGGKKQTFGDKVIELKTMLDSAKNANTAAVFGKMSQADITASVAKVVAISDQAIIAHCNKYAPGTDDEKTALANKLIARKADMLSKYPMAGKIATRRQNSWVNLKPGEKIVESGEKFGVKFVKIEMPAKGFNAAGIPSPYTYDKSSSKFVNDQNTSDIKAIYDKAMTKVSPDEITDMDFDQIVKETGEKTGLKIKVDQHPSKAYVKEYLTQVASELSAQMKPTYRVEHSGSFADSYNNAARSISQSVSALKFEQFKAWKTKAADYLVLDAQAGDGVPTPEAGQFHEVEPTSKDLMAFKIQSDAGFNNLNESEKKACKQYTGSAYAKWNEAMRTGDIGSVHFANGAPMRNAFSKAAVDLPEGIILHRGIGVGGETYKSVVGAVIQDGSFQSCSYGSKAAFSGHQSQLRLHVTKGVKGMMATSFSNFGTAEREIILHPNCRYVVMKVTNVNGKNVVDVLVLPHKD